MPIGYTIDAEQRLVFVRAWGTVTDANLRAQARALTDDSRRREEFRLLIDSRGVTGHGMTLSLLQKYPTPFSKLAPRAVVVGDVYGYALAEVYSRWNAGEGSAFVTRDIREAFKWLGLPEDTGTPEDLDAVFRADE